MSDLAQQLCQRAQGGDLEAASQLVNQFHERLFAWFRRLTGHDHDAADLTQKTFCKAWRALGSYQGRSSFSTWLHGIGHHVYLDWLRGRRRPEPVSEEWWQHCADPGPGPAEVAVDREQAEQVYRWVEQLPEDTRQTVHLHYYQGLSIAETAEVLGIATSTVKYRLREAVSFLQSKTAEPGIRAR